MGQGASGGTGGGGGGGGEKKAPPKKCVMFFSPLFFLRVAPKRAAVAASNWLHCAGTSRLRPLPWARRRSVVKAMPRPAGCPKVSESGVACTTTAVHK